MISLNKFKKESMKKLLIILAASIGIAFMVDSCKKTGGDINPLSSVAANGIGAYLVLDKTNNLFLDYTAITTSIVSIDVHYYAGGESVDHVILYGSTSSGFDTTQWHSIKSVPYASSKTTLNVTGAELATALGVDPSTLTPGTNYTIFTRVVTKSGKTYDGYNTGDNSGGGLITGAAYNTAFTFVATVVCPYDASTATGKYKITQDDWTPFITGIDPTGTIVTLTALSNDTLDLSQALPDGASGARVDSGGSVKLTMGRSRYLPNRTSRDCGSG